MPDHSTVSRIKIIAVVAAVILALGALIVIITFKTDEDFYPRDADQNTTQDANDALSPSDPSRDQGEVSQQNACTRDPRGV